MAKGDRAKSGSGLAKDTRSELDVGREDAVVEIATKQQQTATIEIGDFLGEMATAFAYREKTGLSEGEWLADPERAFTDGHCFGAEYRSPSQQKLQITLSLDGSQSMWNVQGYNDPLMTTVGPIFTRMDKLIRMAVRDLPEGAVSYMPFVFNSSSVPLPEKWVERFQSPLIHKKTKSGEVHKGMSGRFMWTLAFPSKDEFEAMRASGEIPETLYRCVIDHGNSERKTRETWKKLTFREIESPTTNTTYLFRAEETLLTPLFRAIQHWERNNDPDAVRLDIILTDGSVEPLDIQQASNVQEERGGRVRTVMLNFMPRRLWSKETMPRRCVQYEVNYRNLTNSIRTAIEEALGDLL
jgi:hypothetical protein